MTESKLLEGYADELAAMVPVAPEGAQHAPGGMLSAILDLVSAVRSKDWPKAIDAVIALLTLFRGTPSTDGGVSFAPAALGMNWIRVFEIIGKILPLLLSV